MNQPLFVLPLLALLASGAGAGGPLDGAPTDPADVCPIMPGETLPADLVVQTGDGQPFDLGAALAEQPTILIFYRGGWCPFCTRHLAEVGKISEELVGMGYQILVVSPDRPEKVREAESGETTSYRYLSDSSMAAAGALGIAFRVEDKLVETYKSQYGIDLEGDSGQTHHLLPVPTALVVGIDRVVRFAYVNPDYKTRVNADVLQAAARAALD